MLNRVAGVISLFLMLPGLALAADMPAVNAGNTAWILTATALVLFMTLPGLALFYGGLVRSKNVLSILMACFAIAGGVSVLWLLGLYSLTFSDGGAAQDWIGGVSKAAFAGMNRDSLQGDIPEGLFAAFQMTFAIITPALYIGAVVERMKFSAVLLFSALWLAVVYTPVTKWVWGGGWLFDMGVRDLAGGIVVHATAGVSALVLAILLGKRKGFPQHPHPPHNPAMVFIGAAMLWVGWFGFNAGSQLAANGSAAMTLIVTHLSACTAALVWMVIEWIKVQRPSALGIATGSIAGLAAITPASGKVGPIGAICIGAASALICWFACAKLKKKYRYDDSLDVFGVHGVGGFVGTILVAVFGSTSFAGGLGDFQIATQLKTQILAALYTTILSGVASYIILKVIALFIPLRVNSDQESQGLDLAEHGEAAYND